VYLVTFSCAGRSAVLVLLFSLPLNVSGVQKIQSLQSNMAEGAQDREAIEQELAKLQNERSCLPNNYGLLPRPSIFADNFF